MRRLLFATLITLILLAPFSAGAQEAANLVYNGDFQLLDANGDPEGWTRDAWNSANSELNVSQAPDGTQAAYIHNLFSNDARWIQTIDVKPETGYVIRFKVLAEDMDAGQGANASIINTFTYSGICLDTGGEWTQGTLYGVTGKDQTSLTLAIRVGGYNATSAGRAWFTDVSMTEEDAPEGYMPASLATLSPAKDGGGSQKDWQSGAPARNTEVIALGGFAILLTALAMITAARKLIKRERAPGDSIAPASELAPRIALICALAFAFILRAVIALKTYGYAVDMGCFLAWSDGMLKHGGDFYNNIGFCDYPPAYMLWLGAVEWLRALFGIASGTQAHILFIKLTPILADIALSVIAYMALRPRAGGMGALLGACAIAFNPALIADSAAWGQVDSVLALLVAVTVLLAVRGKWGWALPVFALAALTKPQALLLAPVGFVALACDAWRARGDRRALAGMLCGLLGACALAYIMCLPFAGVQAGEGALARLGAPVRFLVSLYTETAAGYSRFTINACNIYSLIGLNWVELDSNTTLSAVAWTLFGLSYAITIALYIIKRERRHIPMLGAMLLALIFCFSPMMHERYLIPALGLLILGYALERDWRLLAALGVLTAAQFINISLVLQGGMASATAEYGHLQSNEAWINGITSFLHILGAAFCTWAAADICVMDRARKLTGVKRLPESPAHRLTRPSDYRLRLRARDYALMGGITAVYALIAFINLGDTKAPQTECTLAGGETVVFDLGEERDFRLTYYGGISPSSFTVAFSNDGESWTEENYASFGAGYMFQWQWYAPCSYDGSKYTKITEAEVSEATRADTGEGGAQVNYPRTGDEFPTQRARYARVTSAGWQLRLREIGFIDTQTGELWDIADTRGSRENTAYSYLTDEQYAVARTPGYMNSMYFDEIYHARTAYEFEQGYSTIFETSHPHLGKLIITLGIKLFGMTPFGWRCMGALAGVIMLPVMYLIVKQLTKRTDLSFIAMFLLAVDSMHFTQTRIATLDSFAVLFIMIMYFFMFRYMQMSINKQPLTKTLAPLALSGLFMGFACATKWIGIYASGGLAVLFFMAIIMRSREYIAARRAQKAGDARLMDTSPYIKSFPKRLCLTLMFCVLAFIIVPVVIYYFSYYFHFVNSPQGFSVKSVWEEQLGMFRYHSGLTYDTHYFRSPWYEWPVIAWPMWYYSSDVAYLGKGVVSSISCMGNPAVWWTGLIALVFALIRLCALGRPGKLYIVIIIAFAAQYLPWLLVPRSTFIYHYFASVPFIIILTALMLGELRKADTVAFNMASSMLLALALALFIVFYPLESGMPCAYEYAMKLRWFNWYNFALQ